MTRRQREFYDAIKAKLSVKDFFKMFESKAKVDNLMNLVMQFRKVCNHPELFERRSCRSAFTFQQIYFYTGNQPVKFQEIPTVSSQNTNPISIKVPKLLFDSLIHKESKTQFINRKMPLFA